MGIPFRSVRSRLDLGGCMARMGCRFAVAIGATILVIGGCATEESPPPKPKLQQMTRWWHFGRMRVGGTMEERIGAERVQVGGSIDEPMDFGLMQIFPPGQGPNAKAEVFSNETGGTYWVSTQAPSTPLVNDAVIGSTAHLHQFQVYRKRDSNAVLHLVVSKAFLEAIDDNSGPPNGLECPWHDPTGSYTDCARVTLASVNYGVTAFSYFDQKTILKTGGGAQLFGFRDAWDRKAYTTFGSNAPFWDTPDFTFDPDVDGTGGGHATLSLAASVTINVPLDSVKVGNDFYVSVLVDASAYNHRQRESYLSAYFRDPVGAAGLDFEFTGLDPIETPLEKPAETVLGAAPACSGGGNGGTLQFASPTFITPEQPNAGGTVLVTRTGGTAGAASATLTTSDGTALAGPDYTAISTIVYFADGEGDTRGIEIPIISDNTAEPDKSLTLTLSAPAGCASLGSQSTATLTIMDDDRPLPPPSGFTVGGTLSGLAGSGLELINFGATVTPSGDGPFAFTTLYSDGLPYEVHVTTQPTNPDQVCSVTNGAGNISGADITNVVVDCVTQAPVSGLDPGYGNGGKVTTGMPIGAVAMALQPDGKAVLVGGQTLARYNTNGTLDGTFGTGGLVTVGFNGGLLDNVLGLALQPDGKIVVVGFTAVGGQDDFAVARYSSTGQLDPTFGTGGNVHIDFGGQTDRAYAALILPGGDIIVAGHAALPITGGFDNDFALARFSSTGVLVSSFGTGGKVTTNIGGRTDLAYAAALQSDGKIVVAGRVADRGGDDPDVGMVRYNDNGSLDLTFGNQGLVRSLLAGWDEASDIQLQPDGKIVLAVQAVVGSNFDFEVARFESDGSPDQGFGTQGIATTSFGTTTDFAKAVALQADGKIVVVGNSALVSNDLTVARFTAGGVLDNSFGTGGKVIVDFFGSSDGAEAIAIQADGKILAAGFARNGSQTGVGVVRIVP